MSFANVRCTFYYTYVFHLFTFKQESQPGTLYIVQAQYEHAGRYECVAKTTQDEVSAGAVLTIEGKQK